MSGDRIKAKVTGIDVYSAMSHAADYNGDEVDDRIYDALAEIINEHEAQKAAPVEKPTDDLRARILDLWRVSREHPDATPASIRSSSGSVGSHWRFLQGLADILEEKP